MKRMIREEAFVKELWEKGMFRHVDFEGKHCLIVGGVYNLAFETYAATLNQAILDEGAADCQNILLFSTVVMESRLDLTDVLAAVGDCRYDYILILGGMEKTRRVWEGARQIQEICRPGGKIFIVSRTPRDISSLHWIEDYEDIWRYEVDDLRALFSSCEMEIALTAPDGTMAATWFVRGADRAKSDPCPLFFVRTESRAAVTDELPKGYFQDDSGLDALGVRHHTDKCSLDHNYLAKYEFFLERFRSKRFVLLELGVFLGSSLRMWQDYFPQAEIFGVDIMENCEKYEDDRIHIVCADLSQRPVLEALREICPAVIVDDASHITSHQILALFTLFDALPSGGIYILEDLETSLNPELFTGVDTELDAYEVCSRIARVAARKVPDYTGPYAEDINRIGMMAELVSITKGSVILIKR